MHNIRYAITATSEIYFVYVHIKKKISKSCNVEDNFNVTHKRKGAKKNPTTGSSAVPDSNNDPCVFLQGIIQHI